MAEPTWFYQAGILVEEQQINFCESLDDVQQVMLAFSQEKPQKGYEVLSEKQSCQVAVKSFTPQKIIQQLAIEANEQYYTVSFLSINTTDDKQLFLFTTRPVKPTQ